MITKKLTLFFVWDEIMIKQYENLQQKKNLKHNLINALPYRDSISTTTSVLFVYRLIPVN